MKLNSNTLVKVIAHTHTHTLSKCSLKLSARFIQPRAVTALTLTPTPALAHSCTHNLPLSLTLCLSLMFSYSATQSGCLPAWQRGLQQQQRLQSNKHTVQESNKIEEDDETQRSEKRKKKKTKRIGLGRVGSLGGWGAFGCVFISVQGCYCRFFLLSSSPTASASVAVAVAAVEGCQPLFALIALSIFAAFQALSSLRLQPRRQRSCCCYFF